LRCEIREKLIAFLQREMHWALPRQRGDVLMRNKPPDGMSRSEQQARAI
jgi:hypothetical protein